MYLHLLNRCIVYVVFDIACTRDVPCKWNIQKMNTKINIVLLRMEHRHLRINQVWVIIGVTVNNDIPNVDNV